MRVIFSHWNYTICVFLFITGCQSDQEKCNCDSAQFDELSNRIAELDHRIVALSSVAPPTAPKPVFQIRHSASDAWLAIRPKMASVDVKKLLGPPTSTRDDFFEMRFKDIDDTLRRGLQPDVFPFRDRAPARRVVHVYDYGPGGGVGFVFYVQTVQAHPDPRITQRVDLVIYPPAVQPAFD